MKAERASRFLRGLGVGLLVLVALLHLQFALQALFQAPAQGVLVLVAAGAFIATAIRLWRHQLVARVGFLGTLPLFLFTVVTTFMFSDESPVFAVMFGLAPLSFAIGWALRSRTSEGAAVA